MKILHVFTIINTPRNFFDGQFKFLSENDQEIHVVTDTPEDVDFSNSNNILYHQITIARKIDPIADLISIRRLMSLIQKEKFDIVVGHTPKGAMVAMMAARLARVKTRIYYRHGLIYATAKGFKRVILKAVEQLTAAFATHIINVSPSLSILAVEDHLNSNTKQSVIGSGTCGGIDTTNIFNPELVTSAALSSLKTSMGILKDDLVIGFCGRICKEKGIRELIDGFNKFNKQHTASKLLLIGAYDTRDILPENYKEEINDNPSIISTGRIQKEQLPLYYSLMDVFVFPSYREGFGMSVIEASAMKVPILVSRSHGCIDSIQEHLTGEYIDLNADGVEKGLRNMLFNDGRIHYGLNGRKWVMENFDHNVLWPKILKFYNGLK